MIVVHHRSTLTVQDTVLDLLSAGLQPPQIHVVDNSEDEETSRELQAGLPGGVCMSTVPNLGYANAVNVGVDHLSVIASSATSILVVTHDVRLAPGALEKMLYALVRDTGVAAVGPLIVNGHRKSRVWSAGGRSTKLLHLPRHTFAGQNADTVPPETVNVDWLDGSVVLSSKRAPGAAHPRGVLPLRRRVRVPHSPTINGIRDRLCPRGPCESDVEWRAAISEGPQPTDFRVPSRGPPRRHSWCAF